MVAYNNHQMFNYEQEITENNININELYRWFLGLSMDEQEQWINNKTKRFAHIFLFGLINDMIDHMYRFREEGRDDYVEQLKNAIETFFLPMLRNLQ